MYNLFIVLFLISLSKIGQSNAKYIQNLIKTTDKNWIYLDRFAFDTNDGTLNYEFVFPEKYINQSFLIYFDAPEQWQNAISEEKDCKQKELITKPYPSANQKLVTSTNNDDNECSKSEYMDEFWYQCSGKREFTSKYPRWWYFAVSNCDSNVGLQVVYTFRLKNSNSWNSQFSYEEFNVLLEIAYSLVFEGLFVVLGVCVLFVLKRKNMLNPLFFLFLISLGLDFTGLILLTIHYCKFSTNGMGFLVMKLCGLILRQFANAIFSFLLLLIASGYKVMKESISRWNVILLLIFSLIFFAINSSIICWKIYLFDPTVPSIFNEWTAAYLMAFMRLFSLLIFLCLSVKSVWNFPSKWRFYLVMSFLGAIWFMVSPLYLLYSNWKVNNWIYSEPILGAETSVMVFGYFVYLIMTLAPFILRSKFYNETIKVKFCGIIKKIKEKCTKQNSNKMEYYKHDLNGIFEDKKDQVNNAYENN